MELRDILKETDLSYRADQEGWSKETVKAEQKKIEVATKTVANLGDALERAKLDKRIAERNGDKAEIKRCDAEIKRLGEEIEKTKISLISQERKLKAYQKSVDSHLRYVGEIVKGHPDLEKEFDETIKSKFAKTLEARKKSKEAAEKKIAPYKLIRETAKQDPSVASMITAIEVHSQTIKEQEKILKDPKAKPEDKKAAQAVLSNAQKNVAKQRKQLEKKFKGKVKPEDIAKIQSLSTLDSDIAKADKQIKGYDAQISQYSQAIKDIEDKHPTQQQQQTQQQQSIVKKEKKPKWYQFIKKFKNWYHKYDTKPEGQDQEQEQEQSQSQPTSEEDKKAFRDSMKYDVMKAYTKSVESEYLDKAKSEVEAQQQQTQQTQQQQQTR